MAMWIDFSLCYESDTTGNVSYNRTTTLTNCCAAFLFHDAPSIPDNDPRGQSIIKRENLMPTNIREVDIMVHKICTEGFNRHHRFSAHLDVCEMSHQSLGCYPVPAPVFHSSSQSQPRSQSPSQCMLYVQSTTSYQLREVDINGNRTAYIRRKLTLG